MSHWQGYATTYSRKVEAAHEAVKAAENALLATLVAEYPLGAHVIVVHSRGSFTGTVSGWDHYGSRVKVTNDTTGKTNKWWAAHVGIVPRRSMAMKPHAADGTVTTTEIPD